MSSKVPARRHWRRWSIFLLSVAILAPLLSIGTMLFFYLKQEIDNRRSIAFMNFEQQAYRIKEMLRDEVRSSIDVRDGAWQLRFNREPKALLIKNEKTLSSVFGQLAEGEAEVLAQVSDSQTDIDVLQKLGQLIITVKLRLDQPTSFAKQQLSPGSYLAVWNLDSNFLAENLPEQPHHLYIINQQSSLIFTSIPEFTEATLLRRALVQDFIRSPLSRAGTPIRTTQKGAKYGFYMTIPDSNLTLFVESSASVLFAPLLLPTSIALALLMGIMGLVIIVWRGIVSSLQEEVQRLAQSLDDFTRGYLIPTQHTPQNFMPELGPLVESINKNTRGLRERVDLIEKEKS